MIRTRDFLVFALVFVFVVLGIGGTMLAQSITVNGQTAGVLDSGASGDFILAGASIPSGAVSPEKESIPREKNIERLRQKVASGEGNISAGEPVFTSVDDILEEEIVITDQTDTEAILIGHTPDGNSILSSELWRFAGFSQFDQVGIALDGTPIYGTRADNAPLDSCGGIDEGAGYRYYIQVDIEITPPCYGL